MAVVAALAATNSGTIKDCYSIWNKNEKSKKTLVYTNTGSLSTSALISKGTCSEIYSSEGQCNTDYLIQKTSDIKRLGFDSTKCWEYAGDDNLVRFQDNNWHVGVNSKDRKILHIKSVNDYMLFAEGVNNQEKKYLDAIVHLDCDLDFKGKHIPIVGIKRDCAFRGVFDGRNHLIWNGTIKDENALYVGLFGYLKGVVANLIFDGRVQSDKNLAGICGLNAGRISCCGSVVRLKAKDERYNAAGIVVNNEGTLDRCYSVLQRKMIIPPFVYILLIALIASIIGVLGYFTIVAALNSGKDYAKIEVDQGQKKNDNDNGPKGEGGMISLELYRNVEISRTAKICKLYFANPSSSRNSLVAELQVVNSSGQRVTVGRSGSVSPGYSIESLPITNPGALSGNETQGYIVLDAYDEVTENKSKVKTELPITISYMD